MTKQGEYLKYPIGSEEGTVEATAFRGSEIELKIRVKDTVLTAKRLLDETPVEVGEKVKVFIYRVYAFDEEKAYVIENGGADFAGFRIYLTGGAFVTTVQLETDILILGGGAAGATQLMTVQKQAPWMRRF